MKQRVIRLEHEFERRRPGRPSRREYAMELLSDAELFEICGFSPDGLSDEEIDRRLAEIAGDEWLVSRNRAKERGDDD